VLEDFEESYSPLHSFPTDLGTFDLSLINYALLSFLVISSMPKAPAKRHGHQPASYELGKVYCSPHRPRDKRKTRAIIKISENAERHESLIKKLELLKRGLVLPTSAFDDSMNEPAKEDDEWVDEDMAMEPESHSDTNPSLEEQPKETKRRILPDSASHHLYSNWRSLIPTLVDGLLGYKARTMGKFVAPLLNVLKWCDEGCEGTKYSKVICLFLDRTSSYLSLENDLNPSPDFREIELISCSRHSLCQFLVRNGLFPTAPSHPRMAVSTHLLDLYQALFERSCDAVNSMAAALRSFYNGRGFQVVNSHVCTTPFSA
jgi:hypothetical protein